MSQIASIYMGIHDQSDRLKTIFGLMSIFLNKTFLYKSSCLNYTLSENISLISIKIYILLSHIQKHGRSPDNMGGNFQFRRKYLVPKKKILKVYNLNLKNFDMIFFA